MAPFDQHAHFAANALLLAYTALIAGSHQQLTATVVYHFKQYWMLLHQANSHTLWLATATPTTEQTWVRVAPQLPAQTSCL
jgi:hypothetical protein